VTGKGGHAIIDPHNYGRYNGAIITDTAGFGTWWKNLASEFQHDSNIIFGNTQSSQFIISHF